MFPLITINFAFPNYLPKANWLPMSVFSFSWIVTIPNYPIIKVHLNSRVVNWKTRIENLNEIIDEWFGKFSFIDIYFEKACPVCYSLIAQLKLINCIIIVSNSIVRGNKIGPDKSKLKRETLIRNDSKGTSVALLAIFDKYGILISRWTSLYQSWLEVSMKTMALWINVCTDDWTA